MRTLLHPDTELRFISPEIGYDVFSTRRIPWGTITWMRDPLGQAFSPSYLKLMPKAVRQVVGKYLYVDGHGDSVLCWDHGRFVNHSCAATCLAPGFDFEIAVRDMPAGTQLTDDYGTLGLTESFDCLCGAKECRGTVTPSDYLHCADRWDTRVAAAVPDCRT